MFFDHAGIMVVSGSPMKGDLAMWTCPGGCNAQYNHTDADMITEHVQLCAGVDGAGQPVRIDGQTFIEWATKLFQYELCHECGGDVVDHLPAIVLGNWFAFCTANFPQ